MEPDLAELRHGRFLAPSSARVPSASAQPEKTSAAAVAVVARNSQRWSVITSAQPLRRA
jgi:hypothetical protein